MLATRVAKELICEAIVPLSCETHMFRMLLLSAYFCPCAWLHLESCKIRGQEHSLCCIPQRSAALLVFTRSARENELSFSTLVFFPLSSRIKRCVVRDVV